MPSPHLKIPVDDRLVQRELSGAQLQELQSLVSVGACRLDRESRWTCGQDASPVLPSLPAVVVFPTHTREVSQVMEFAHRERIPVTARGAGTGKVGGAIPLHGGIVLGLEKMNSLLEIDAGNRIARVHPGVITGDLRRKATECGLLYPVDPNSLDACSVGGNVAANAAGPSSMKYGSTRNQVLALEVVVPGGDILRIGRETTKCSTGLDLVSLVCGSEGTLAVITEITVRLQPLPRASRSLFASFGSAGEAVEALGRGWLAGLDPVAAEFFDVHAMAAMRSMLGLEKDSGAGLLMEINGSGPSVEEGFDVLFDTVMATATEVLVARDEADRRRFWDARKVVSERVKQGFARYISEDVAVPPGRLPALVEFLQDLRRSTGLDIVCYGHAGDGNLHVNFLYQEDAAEEPVGRAIEALFRQVIVLGGTLSGEHGIGCTKRKYMCMEQSSLQIGLQRRLKAMFDPHGILNPGKVFP